jgi:hypothetical protein
MQPMAAHVDELAGSGVVALVGRGRNGLVDRPNATERNQGQAGA